MLICSIFLLFYLEIKTESVPTAIKKFGETYCTMKLGDWYHVVKNYVERQTHRNDVRDDEEVTWLIAAETGELAPIMVAD